jgi:flagellar biosynthesis/type III secretory pathway chaperone
VSALAPAVQSTPLGAAVLAHLDAQLASGRRLLDAILRQGAATRRQEVETVLHCLTEIQGEMERRGRLEQDRTNLLVHAAGQLSRPAHEVTLDALSLLLSPAEATAAHERSAELRGLLAEIQREHQTNRSLMRQELAFLDHLVRLFNADDGAGATYGPGGAAGGTAANGTPAPAPVATHRVLDMRA